MIVWVQPAQCFYATSRECDEGEQGILHCSKPQALTVLELIVDLLFWWDLVLNFRTAYIPKHARDRGYITTPKRLALNYLKGWRVHSFAPRRKGHRSKETPLPGGEEDGGSCICSSTSGRNKLRPTGPVDQVSAANFFRIFQLLFFVCLLSHWVASAWFFAAAWQYKGKDSDVDIYEADEWDCNSWSGCPWVMEEGIANATLTTQYWTSMYWAQLMLTSVSPPVHAYTNLERGFVCTVALLGAVVSAFLFGNVAVLMQRFDLQSSRMQDHMAQINLFLRFHDVPKELSTRVRNNIEGLWKLSSGWDTGALLSGLPDCLVKDVQMEVHREMISSAKVLHQCSSNFVRALVRDMCSVVFVMGDVVMHANEENTLMCLIQKGSVVQFPKAARSKRFVLSEGDMFGCEHLIEVAGDGMLGPLLGEHAAGDAGSIYKANSYLELCMLSLKKFHQLLECFPEDRSTLARNIKERKAFRERSRIMTALVCADGDDARFLAHDAGDLDGGDGSPSSSPRGGCCAENQQNGEEKQWIVNPVSDGTEQNGSMRTVRIADLLVDSVDVGATQSKSPCAFLDNRIQKLEHKMNMMASKLDRLLNLLVDQDNAQDDASKHERSDN
ncbi:hypothetical protein CYMTET_17440 [Cymbomonas tetramitiformis]|uniref:Cyclic nucleotide-binding domain-containing protein n=1 Tax=Cymbomonas tetramitiformis TaxID=36881 RepID=A0AAE0GAN2_9CHLO|nr:hypothetical protein CYMTET_17440 [Cymbomonas tetramitiformis]